MSNWFECKVSYDKLQENGSVKTNVPESFLVDALSFTEAEARIIQERTPYISGDFNVKAVKRTKISEIFWDETGDRYFLAKIAFTTIDPKTGSEKRTTTLILVQASNFRQALDNLEEGMRGTASDYDIVSITETHIEDVYRVKLDKFEKSE